MAELKLRDDKSASVIFYEVLLAAINKFELDTLEFAWPTSASAFKKQYLKVLPLFEVYRLGHKQRYDIARFLAKGILEYLVTDEGSSLAEYLLQEATPLSVKDVKGDGASGWQPRFSYDGQDWHDFAELGSRLYQDNVISPGAYEALTWAERELIQADGISLQNRKVVVFGAAAEMASTREFLAAGAEVLWLDRIPPSDELLEGHGYSGTLVYAESNADLLNQPREVLATIKAFAGNGPVDLCLYAYAPGQARELRLTGVMCAMVNALPSELISSVTMLVSPTTASALESEDVDVMEARLEDRPVWESFIDMIGLLGVDGGYESRGAYTTIRSLVGIQGASYQAAQYLCKLIMAEAWATHGQLNDDSAKPLRVSANTAAITQTRSLDHPVFDAAFGGAAALQVQTFMPEQSQCINALLAIVDWLKEETPVPGKIRVHGGIHTLPYPLEAALKPAAAIGFAKSPGFLPRLLGIGR